MKNEPDFKTMNTMNKKSNLSVSEQMIKSTVVDIIFQMKFYSETIEMFFNEINEKGKDQISFVSIIQINEIVDEYLQTLNLLEFKIKSLKIN